MPSETDRERVAELLGRQPRGLEEVAVRRADGSPVVIRVASLVDDRPFPTLFWLVDPGLCYELDQLEAGGAIAALQAEVDESTELRAALAADHRAHIHLRDKFLQVGHRRRLEALGFAQVLATKGIGGIANFARIRCLHTWYAAHLVEANTVGRFLERRHGVACEARGPVEGRHSVL